MTTPEQFIAFAERIPDAVILSDTGGVITDVNEHACSLFGYSRTELIGMEIDALVPVEARTRHRAVRAVHQNEGRVRPMHAGMLFTGRRKDGSLIPLDIGLNPLETTRGPRTISVIRDISSRIRLEDAIRESEERYRSLVELSPEAIVVHAAGIIVYVNDAAVRLFGVPAREELIGKSILDLTPAPYRDHVQRRITRTTQEGERGEPILIRSVRPDGEEFFLEALGARVTYNGQPAGQVLLRDITARVRAEEELKKSREELRNLSTHLQSAREAERASVAREIHDELGGALTALKMDLATLEDALPLQGNDDIRRAIAERVEAMAGLIDSTVKTMRRLITELRPVLLDSLGLVSAMEWLAEDFQNRTGVACSFHPPADDIDIDRDRSTAVYRIFQEALTNVVRHAAATRVRATLEFGDGGLTLTVDDDGRGFDEESTRTAKTFGILGMRERALIFGGEVTVRRRPGGGTTVLLVLPAGDA